METQNTMEEKKTITIEEVQEAINLLRTFTEQHENSALIVALHSGPNISLCSYGQRGGIAGVLSLYAVKCEAIKDILSDVGAMLKDDSKEGGEVPRYAPDSTRHEHRAVKKFWGRSSLLFQQVHKNSVNSWQWNGYR